MVFFAPPVADPAPAETVKGERRAYVSPSCKGGVRGELFAPS